MSCCLACHRTVHVQVDHPSRALPETDYCRWCAKPTSARASAVVPHEGWQKAAARGLAGSRTCGTRQWIRTEEVA